MIYQDFGLRSLLLMTAVTANSDNGP